MVSTKEIKRARDFYEQKILREKYYNRKLYFLQKISYEDVL